MRFGRKKDEDVALKTETGGTGGAMIWKCPACGAFNDDSEQVCSECTALRADAPAVPKAPELPEADKDDWEAPEAKSAAPESFEESESEDAIQSEQLEEPEAKEPEPEESEVRPPYLSSTRTPIPTPTFTISPPTTTTTPTGQSTGQGRYYLTFVNTPAQSLIKTKVSINFEDFDNITIGRSPENVVVIPDQEVSRTHAELTMDGTRLMLKDLKSKNGTYLYNGKTFQQVSDSVEVKPNSMIKFGTGTIVRITSE